VAACIQRCGRVLGPPLIARVPLGLVGAPFGGNTFGMKIAVSIPDDVFADAERLASRMQTSRSKLYARALAEFVARHDDDRVTALMDEAVREAGGHRAAFVAAAARQSMQRAEW
jgi:predicted transcriptional regulator